MRILRCAVVSLSLLAGGCARPAEAPPPSAASPSSAGVGREAEEASAALARVGVTVRELAPDVLLAVQASPRQSSANVLVVRARDGSVVLCSSPYDTEATRALVRYVRATLRPTRIIAINTHFHADGTAGNEAYDAEGVETYASDHTAALQAERGAAGIEGMARYVEESDPALAARIRATRVAPPRHVFPERDGLRWSLGGESVRVVHLGGAHSADNVVVHFVDRGVLFGGCMVRADPGLGNTADADLAGWSATAEAALALAPRIVIPGHGAPGGPELLSATAEAARGK